MSPNGGVVSENGAEKKVRFGERITSLPAVSRNGYRLLGLNLLPDGSGFYVREGDSAEFDWADGSRVTLLRHLGAVRQPGGRNDHGRQAEGQRRRALLLPVYEQREVSLRGRGQGAEKDA